MNADSMHGPHDAATTIPMLADLNPAARAIFLAEVQKELTAHFDRNKGMGRGQAVPTVDLAEDGTLTWTVTDATESSPTTGPIVLYAVATKVLGQMTGRGLDIPKWSEREELPQQVIADISGALQSKLSELITQRESGNVVELQSIHVPRTTANVTFELNGMQVKIDGRTGHLELRIDDAQTYTIKPAATDTVLELELPLAPGIKYSNGIAGTRIEKVDPNAVEAVIRAIPSLIAGCQTKEATK